MHLFAKKNGIYNFVWRTIQVWKNIITKLIVISTYCYARQSTSAPWQNNVCVCGFVCMFVILLITLYFNRVHHAYNVDMQIFYSFLKGNLFTDFYLEQIIIHTHTHYNTTLFFFYIIFHHYNVITCLCLCVEKRKRRVEKKYEILRGRGRKLFEL